MERYRRRLPHWHPEGASIFLTWRLFGSMPSNHLVGNTDGERFAAFDRELDRAASGPTWLKNPQVAESTVRTLFIGQDKWNLYKLHAWVIMSNHVHALLTPSKPLREVTRAVKSASARSANEILNRSGQSFWAIESYDHWVRNDKQFNRIVSYIERNPVQAGLADWPWSSACCSAF